MRTPVMMVHGMCCTGAVWRNFRQYFEARGASVHTPTLWPEARRQGCDSAALSALRVRDYVDQLQHEADRIEQQSGERPVVIGHSMGGMLAQLLAEAGAVRAAVLISPVPPLGARALPERLFWNGVRLFGAPDVIVAPQRWTLRSVLNAAPPQVAKEALRGFVPESGRAFRELATFRIDETRIHVPLLTIAASRDRTVPARSVRLTAKKYERIGGEFLEYEHHGHWLYAEPGWEGPAEDIYEWIALRAAAPAPAPTHREHREAAPHAVSFC